MTEREREPLEVWKDKSGKTWSQICGYLGCACTKSQVRKWFTGERPLFDGYPDGKSGVINRLLSMEQPAEAREILTRLLARGEPPATSATKKGPATPQESPNRSQGQGSLEATHFPGWHSLPIREEIRLNGKIRFYTGILCMFELPCQVSYGGHLLDSGKLFTQEDSVRFLGYLIASGVAHGFTLCETLRDLQEGKRVTYSPDWFALKAAVDPLQDNALRGMVDWLKSWAKDSRVNERLDRASHLEHLGWSVALCVLYESKVLDKVRAGLTGCVKFWTDLLKVREAALEALRKRLEDNLDDRAHLVLDAQAEQVTAMGEKAPLPSLSEVQSDHACSLAAASSVGAYLDLQAVLGRGCVGRR